MLSVLPALLVLAADPAPAEDPLAPALAPLAPLVGGSWVGQGSWSDGRPFFARHVFEGGLGGRFLRVRSYARREGVETPLFETSITPLAEGSELSLYTVAAFGTTYSGSCALASDPAEPTTLELDYTDGSTGEAYGQTFELLGADAYRWTSYRKQDGSPELLAEIEFHREPLVPLPGGERAVRAEVVVDAPAADVWEAWTTEAGLRTFFAPAAEVELRVGGAYEIYFDPGAPAGRRGAEGTRILAIDPGRMLAFTWDSTPRHAVRGHNTSVTLRLQPLGPELTRVTLVNSGFGEGSDWPSSQAYFARAWPSVLTNLAERFVSEPETRQAEGGAAR